MAFKEKLSNVFISEENPPGPLLKLINETVLTCYNVLFIFQLCFMSLTQKVDSHLSLLHFIFKINVFATFKSYFHKF